MRRILLSLTLGFAIFAGAGYSHATVVISEFMAQNDGGLADQNGDTPDWIELHNTGGASVPLAGWHLTDTPTNLTKWTFPATNLAPGGYLIVFASGKNRATNGAELHTNFQLNEGGGYLALVAADGTTILSAFNYPEQRANVSFGLGRQATTSTLLATGAVARFFVPSNSALGSVWTTNSFDDSAWATTVTPLGFNAGLSVGSTILSVDFNERVTNEVTYTAAGFQSFVINSNISVTTIQTQATTRVFGGLTVTVSNTAPLGYDDRHRLTPVNSGSFTDSLLLRDFIFSRETTGTGGLDVTISGLASNAPYQLTVWSFDTNSAGGRCANWFANSNLVKSQYRFDGRIPPTSNNDYKFTFSATSDALGRVLLAGRRDATSTNTAGTADLGVYLNAFQVVELVQGSATNTLGSLMFSNNASAYARVPFTVADPNAVSELTLRARYDDGFLAYLNGQLVASRNAPGSPAFNSAATAAHSGAASEDIVFIPPPDALVAGANVLALQALNVSANDPDLFLEPQIIATQVTDFTNRFLAPATPGANNDLGFTGLEPVMHSWRRAKGA